MVKLRIPWRYILAIFGFVISVVPSVLSMMGPRSERIYDWDMFAEAKEVCQLLSADSRLAGSTEWAPVQNFYKKAQRYKSPLITIVAKSRETALRAYCFSGTENVRGNFRCFDDDGNVTNEAVETKCLEP
jgi:hypothetical protein